MWRRPQEKGQSPWRTYLFVWTYLHLSTRAYQASAAGYYFWTSTRICIEVASQNRKAISQQLLWLLWGLLQAGRARHDIWVYSPNTPQQNWQAERKFATLYRRVRVMMGVMHAIARHQHFVDESSWYSYRFGYVIWLHIRPRKLQNSYQNFYGNKKQCFASANNLKTFGEEVIAVNRTKIKTKFREHGKKCLWLARICQGSVPGYLQAI